MRSLILLLLASCTYPVTNVVNEINALDASAAAQGVDATLSDDSSVVTESDALQVVDSALPLAESGADAGVDAGPFAVCVTTTFINYTPATHTYTCGAPFSITWGGGGQCTGQNFAGPRFSGSPCTTGETCIVMTSNVATAEYGKCQ